MSETYNENSVTFLLNQSLLFTIQPLRAADRPVLSPHESDEVTSAKPSASVSIPCRVT